MAKFSHVPSESTKHEGFSKYSKLFCDSIIFWGLCNAMSMKTKNSSVGKFKVYNKFVQTLESAEREPGCTAITLVPGGHKGMFPYQDDCPDGAKKIHEVGIVEVDNIKIAWPKKCHNRGSTPLAEIVELNEEDDDDENIKKIQISNTSSYQPGYIVLEPDTEYTIVTAGYATYRGSCYIHFITECGVKV
ncbi:MAG: hypothetical protein BYD32DRAFT_432709 [Podila humilis]|nr:MAG: hypothetical protein BYD32DRAFT_432709 [Podila humilis]